MKPQWLSNALLLVVMLPLIAACETTSTNLAPVEIEQIKNVVEDYYVRNTSTPDQEVEIQEVAGTWARVSIKPVGVETQPDLFFLQNHAAVADEAPAAQTTVQLSVILHCVWTVTVT